MRHDQTRFRLSAARKSCAQCGQPIPLPDWSEDSQDRTIYLWSCRCCGYRFEAIAIYHHQAPQPLAA